MDAETDLGRVGATALLEKDEDLTDALHAVFVKMRSPDAYKSIVGWSVLWVS